MYTFKTRRTLVDRIVEEPDVQLRFISILAILLVVVMILTFAQEKRTQFNVEDYEITNYYVEQGDTFWGISKEYCPETLDVRVYMSNIIKLNGYEGKASELQYGECIQVYKHK